MLSKGSPEREANREFHISVGKNAAFAAMGVRRWFRGPFRPGPTIPLLSTPIAIHCVSPKPLVGEWQPPHVLSLFKPVTVSNQRLRPKSASCRSTFLPSRGSKVASMLPVNPASLSTDANCASSALPYPPAEP